MYHTIGCFNSVFDVRYQKQGDRLEKALIWLAG